MLQRGNLCTQLAEPRKGPTALSHGCSGAEEPSCQPQPLELQRCSGSVVCTQYQCSGVPSLPVLLPGLKPQKDQCTTLQHFINDQQ